MSRPRRLLVSLGLLVGAGCSGADAPPPPVPQPSASAAVPAPTSSAMADPEPPVPTRRADVEDVLHGVRIADPYRWLEDGDAPEVQRWTEKQNQHTQKELASKDRGALVARLEKLLRVGSLGTPAVVPKKRSHTKKDLFFFTRQDPKDDQPILFVRDGDGGADRALLDPNGKASDKTVALDYWFPSPDGKLLAYGLSSGGDEKATLRVMEVATGKDLGETEVIPNTRYASVAWLPDGKGFYYTRYPEKGEVAAGDEVYFRKVFLHTLGKPWRSDPLVFGDGRKKTDSPGVGLSPNGRWAVAVVHMGWARSELYLMDRKAKAPAWTPIAVPEKDAIYGVDVFDDHLLVKTNDGAPTYQLFRVDPAKPARKDWKLLIPAGTDVLSSAAEIAGELYVVAMRDAHSVLKHYDKAGKLRGEVELPTIGTITMLSAEWDATEAFFGFSSYTIPRDVYRLDPKSGKTKLWGQVKPPVDPKDFAVEQRRAKSKDGTQIPFFLVRRKDVKEDGSAPALLHGYGGFNIPIQPEWNGGRYVFLEAGGVAVWANLRGGSEYGEAWHQAGMLDKKQNVFDDFAAVGEELVKSRVTSSARLGIIGGSNGGLLIGAAVMQHPTLFRAAVSMVPLLDMVRYHKFRIAQLWIPEYGSADDPKQFEWLRAYSPYHNVKEQQAYPAVLFSTAESDSRVDPLHARKMAALLQRVNAKTAPDRRVLLRVESKAGHGAGKPVSKRIDEQADVMTFLFQELGMKLGGGGGSP